jgi:tRNA-dihydrouridine synthase B
MKSKPVNIGGIVTENNVFMAPLAGYTNYPFRKLVIGYGAGLAVTEMVSAKGLHYGSENTEKLLLTGEEEKIKVVQLFGSEPSIMREACESEALAPFDIVDINMGCPMPKIFNNGEGCALLENIPLAAKIVEECKKSGKRITVKMRIGLTDDKLIGVPFAKAMEEAGADMLTVHGRTRERIYAGEPNYAEMARIKSVVHIPVIANGGICSVADGEAMLEKTGADGIALARAAMYDPQLFCDFSGRAREGKKEMILRQLSDMGWLFDEHFTTVYMRKMAVFYLKGEKGVSSWKEKLFSCKSTSALRELVEEIFSYRK